MMTRSLADEIITNCVGRVRSFPETSFSSRAETDHDDDVVVGKFSLLSALSCVDKQRGKRETAAHDWTDQRE